MFILLLSHALVELPKRLYHLSAIGVRSKLYCHELGAAAAELELEEPQWASWSSLPSTRPEDSAPSACLAPPPSLRPWAHVQGGISKTAVAVTAKITDPYRRRPRHERPVGLGRCRWADSELRP